MSFSDQCYSNSSALPPGWKRPPLTARIHHGLSMMSQEELQKVTMEDLIFRPLQACDLEDIQCLHGEWFPLKYQKSFYEAVSRGVVFSLAAFLRRKGVRIKSSGECGGNASEGCCTSLSSSSSIEERRDRHTERKMEQIGRNEEGINLQESTNHSSSPFPYNQYSVQSSSVSSIRSGTTERQCGVSYESRSGDDEKRNTNSSGHRSSDNDETSNNMYSNTSSSSENMDENKNDEEYIAGLITISRNSSHMRASDRDLVLGWRWPWNEYSSSVGLFSSASRSRGAGNEGKKELRDLSSSSSSSSSSGGENEDKNVYDERKERKIVLPYYHSSCSDPSSFSPSATSSSSSASNCHPSIHSASSPSPFTHFGVAGSSLEVAAAAAAASSASSSSLSFSSSSSVVNDGTAAAVTSSEGRGEDGGGGCGGGCGETSELAYVLTLGVVDEMRRKGLARELLRRALDDFGRQENSPKAIYLHVVDYNGAAMKLYEGLNFVQLQHLVSYYNLQGQPHGSYLYAYYFDKSQKPLGCRFQEAVKVATNSLTSVWQEMWHCKHRQQTSYPSYHQQQ